MKEAFRQGTLLNCGNSNPRTGVNLPVRRVIILDHRRWSSIGGGSMPFVMEIRQMLGELEGLNLTTQDAWIPQKMKMMN